MESIAMEEVGIANVINAESCKIKKTIEIATSIDDLIKINKSVKCTLQGIEKSQMLLNMKLCKVKELITRL